MTRRITHSELKMFKRCKREWRLRYLEHLHPEREVEVSPRGLGTIVHEALNVHYDLDDDRDPVAVVQERTEENAEIVDTPSKKKDVLDQGDLALAMVEGYLDWLAETGADEDFEIVAPEQAVTAPLGTFGDTDVVLLGKLDVRVKRRSDGRRMFLDHKTVQNFPQETKGLPIATQPKHYLLLERLAFPDDVRCDGAVWNMLRKVKRTARAKPPFYERAEVRHNDETLRNYYRQVVGLVQQMLAAEKALESGSHQAITPPSPGRYCEWGCDFRRICGMFDDGSDVDGVIRSYYTVRSPLERYDETEEEAA